MTPINVMVLVLIAICGLGAVLLVARGLLMRSALSGKPYGVARQETRHDMQVSFLRAAFLLILTMILLGIYGLRPGDQAASTEGTTTPTITPTETAGAPTETAAAEQEEASTPTIEPTRVTLTATVAATATATNTVTRVPTGGAAVVNSPNGLWLREAPGGTQQVELIAHETELELLPGRETAGEFEWQQVRTPAGNEGWVATEFLSYPE